MSCRLASVALLALALTGCVAGQVDTPDAGATFGSTGSAASSTTGTSASASSTGSDSGSGSGSGSGTGTGTGSTASTSSTSGSSGATSSGSSGSSGFAPGPHPPWPVVPVGSGAQLAAPEPLAITFDADAAGNDGGYPYQATVEAFASWMAASWISTVGAEYGVGTGRALTPVRLAESAPTQISDAEVRQFLQDRINSGALPAPDPSSIYMVFYPRGTQITLGSGVKSCVGFAGYHFDAHLTVAGQQVTLAYAVLPDCDTATAGLTELQQIEVAASHELFEAATDPIPDDEPTFILLDSSSPWAQNGGELGDLCESDYQRVSGTPYIVQRVWSNERASGDASPCVPAPDPASQPFLGVAPAQSVAVSGNAGQTVQVPLVGWSTAPHAAWPIIARSIAGDFDPTPSVAPSSIGNGGTATLSLHIPASASSGQDALVWVYTQQSLSNDSQWWPVYVRVN